MGLERLMNFWCLEWVMGLSFSQWGGIQSKWGVLPREWFIFGGKCNKDNSGYDA